MYGVVACYVCTIYTYLIQFHLISSHSTKKVEKNSHRVVPQTFSLVSVESTEMENIIRKRREGWLNVRAELVGMEFGIGVGSEAK